MSSFIDKEDLRQQLHPKLPALVPTLFSDTFIERTGSKMRVGNKGSLCVNIAGQYTGMWKNFETGESGDVYDLVKLALGGSFCDVLDWCKSHVGHLVVTSHSVQQKIIDRTPLEKIKYAQKIFDQSQSIAGTLGEQYFRQRSISIALNDDIRFHHSLHCGKKNSNERMPAVVVAVRDEGGVVVGVHRISLNADGTQIQKRHLGTIGGHGVRLGNPQSHVYLCEGLEDGLSLMQIYPDAYAICVLGGRNFAKVNLHEEVQHITIAADSDDAGERAAFKAQEKLAEAGYEVDILYPPQGKDFNEFLQMGGE